MRILLFIQLLLLSPIFVYSGPDTLVSIHCRNATFDEFSLSVEKQSGMHIYYKQEWVKDLRITMNEDLILPSAALSKALAGTNLKISRWNDGYVVLQGSFLPESLPEYAFNKVTKSSKETGSEKVTQSEERYLVGRNADFISTVHIGKKSQAVYGKAVSIKARITDGSNGEPVIGATMYIEELRNGSVSDVNGSLVMIIKPGTYHASFSFMGMQSKKHVLEVHSEGEFTVELERSVIQMKEVVVYGDQQMSMQRKDPGLEKLAAKSIREIPMLLGERDILKVSEMLPGIVTVGEGSSGLNVRGGNYDQNAFYLNGVTIYNPSHMFGFFSSFNSDIIKDFSIYKGHVPVKYGGRLSSVFNIIARQGNRKRYTAHGGVSPVAANLSVEGPLKKDTSSFLFSIRTLYSDWLLKKIKDPTINQSKAGFNDISFSWNYDLARNHWAVFGYHSQDNFQLADMNDYKYANNGFSVNLVSNFSANHYGSFTVSASGYSFSTTEKQWPSEAFKHSYSLMDYRFCADFSWVLGSRNTFEYGAVINYLTLDKGKLTPYGSESIKAPIVFGKEQGLETALYLSDKIDVFPWLNIVAGVRLAEYANLGPGNVYTYAPGSPLDTRYLQDTLVFGKREVISSQFQPDIRTALNFVTGKNGSIKFSFNQLHQNIFVLNNTIALSPNAQWKLADYYIRPARSNQFSAGVFRVFPEVGLETSFETYYKKILDNPEFIDGADFMDNPLSETLLLPGKQDAYGFECFVKRNGRRVEGWLSYTYSRSIVQINGEKVWQKINNGLAYPANYDIPHVVNAVINFHLNRRITASTVISYQTGRPVTYPISVYYQNGIPYVEYSERNAYRIPDYFRMDLALTVEGNLRRNKPLHNSLILGVYNLTGRQNPYSVYFVSENGRIRSYQYSVIGIPIFTVTWSFKLGNYAAS